MKRIERSFSVALTEAINEGLCDICPSIRSAVLFYLEKNGSIQSDKSITNLEAFEEGLNNLFGFGARVIERKILEVLYIKLQTPKEIKDDFEFIEEVENALKLVDAGSFPHACTR